MSDTPEQNEPRPRLPGALLRWGRACGVIATVLIIATEIAGGTWPIVGATPYLPQLAFVALAGVVLLMLARWRGGAWRWADRWIASLAGITGLYAVAVTYGLVPGRVVPAATIATDPTGPTITILYANVHTSNTDHARLLDLIRRSDPDVILLVELNSSWLRALKPLDETYPHRRVVPDDAGNFGMGFWTRLETERAEFVLLKPEAPGTLYDVPQLEAVLHVKDAETTRPLHVLGLHPLPPLSPGNLAARDAVLRGARLSADANAGMATIIVGDLNATRYCRILQEITRDRFRDAGAAYRYSWPDTWSWWAMGIRLDHLLVDDGIAVQSLSMDESIGSDHRPIVARVMLTK